MTQEFGQNVGSAVLARETPVVSPRDKAMARLKRLEPIGMPDTRRDLTPSALELIRAEFPNVIRHLSGPIMGNILADFPTAQARVISDMVLLSQDGETRAKAAEVAIRMLIHDGSLRPVSLDGYPFVLQSQGLYRVLSDELENGGSAGLSYPEEQGFKKLGNDLLITRLMLEAASPIEGNIGDADYEQRCRKVATCRRLLISVGQKGRDVLTTIMVEEKAYLDENYGYRKEEYKGLFSPPPRRLVAVASAGWAYMTPAERNGLGDGE